MMFAKVVAMKCDTEFIPSQDRDMADILLWTANIHHGLFKRKTAVVRSFDGINWRIVGTDAGEPGMTVWSMLVDRYFAMQAAGITSWAAPRK